MANPQVILSITAEDNATAAIQAIQTEMRSMAEENKKLQSQLKGFNRTSGDLKTGLDQTKAPLRNFRSGMAQIGYQIQDIAVQIQGGQNLGVILGQQGSQIASVFGPGGIAAGAIISIGALLGTALVPALFKSKESMDELAASTRKYTEDLKYASQVQRDFVAAQEETVKGGLRTQLSDLEEKSTNLVKARESLQKLLADPKALMALGAATPEVNIAELYKSQLIEVKASAERTSVEIANLQSQLGINAGANALKQLEIQVKASGEYWNKRIADEKKAQEELLANEIIIQKTLAEAEQKRIDDANKRAQELIGIEKMLYETFLGFETKKAEEQAKLREGVSGIAASLMTENEQAEALFATQLEMITAARMEGVSNEDEYTELLVGIATQRADKLLAIEEGLAKAKDELQKTANDAFLTNMNRQVDILQGAFGESSAIGKAFFLFQQSMAAANAIVNGYDAAMKIKASIPVGGDAMAGASIAMGYASAAAIMGQTLGSFEGGGYTGMGIRAGGVDGRGGMPAILHPNESVIDHTQGQGMGSVVVNLTVQANDTAGFDRLLQQRRGLIVSMINQAVNNRGRASLA